MTTPAVAPASPEPTLLVPTAWFGPLRVSPTATLLFPEGLLGFAAQRRYLLLPAAADGIYWLQSCDEAGLAFLLADPFVFFPHYDLEVPEGHPVLADGTGPDDVAVLAVVTLARGQNELCTANLRAPLLIHLRHRTGFQLVLDDLRYSTREPFDLAAWLRSQGSSFLQAGR